jgi:hypothetical protein
MMRPWGSILLFSYYTSDLEKNINIVTGDDGGPAGLACLFEDMPQQGNNKHNYEYLKG